MFANAGSARLAYDVTGEGPGVLLVHAGVTDRRSWAPTIARLSAGHRCIAYDARGYGDSRYGVEPFSRSADALAVLDAAQLDRAVVIAASMGARTALNLTLAHPDRVSALVLIGATVSGQPERPDVPPDIAHLWPLLDAAEQAGDLSEINRLEAWLWLDGPTAPEGRVRGAVRELFLTMNARALAAPEVPDEDADLDAWSRLAEVSVPTLILVGDLDLQEIQDSDAQLAQRIAGARLVRLPGVAHLPHLESDAACLREIVDFVVAL